MTISFFGALFPPEFTTKAGEIIFGETTFFPTFTLLSKSRGKSNFTKKYKLKVEY